MSLIGALIQMSAGALGGAGVGRASKTFGLGLIANALTGAIGAGVGGQLLGSFIPTLATTASSGSFDIAALAGQAAGGGLTGAVVTLVVGIVKERILG